MEWEPIETAPRDGTAILTYAEKDASEPILVGYFKEDDDGGHIVETWRDDGAWPTHWLPLPKPPTQGDR